MPRSERLGRLPGSNRGETTFPLFRGDYSTRIRKHYTNTGRTASGKAGESCGKVPSWFGLSCLLQTLGLAYSKPLRTPRQPIDSSSQNRSVAFQAAMPPFLGAFFLLGFPSHSARPASPPSRPICDKLVNVYGSHTRHPSPPKF